MKKYALLVFTIILALLCSYLIRERITKFNRTKTIYESYLGKTFIIKNDTLTIIDYSIFGSTFTLSNGNKVNYNLVHTKKTINDTTTIQGVFLERSLDN